VLLAIDVTKVAALIAAATGLVAAVVGLLNLGISIIRERPAIKVFAREWAADMHGSERYIEVVVSNARRRQNTVVTMGLRLQGKGRTWPLENGTVKPSLPAKLEDGAVATMIWMRDELGQAFHEGDALITGCFAIDAHGEEIRGAPPSE
jgi:hypothetical protein